MSDISIATIVGARPQFIKASAVSRAFDVLCDAKQSDGPLIKETLIHTGQHYDEAMSQVFFNQLGLKEPKLNLNVGSGTHGLQTGRMLEKIEAALLEHSPDGVLVYGDTNSTMAGALAASKLHLPVIHVEAGLRSFNKKMPEEVNRILTDHMSSLLFCPTSQAVTNLRREAITEGVHLVGDIMYDSIQFYLPRLRQDSSVPEDYGLNPGQYILATVHRPENTDDPSKLGEILWSFEEIAKHTPIILVLHPRTAEKIKSHGLGVPAGVTMAPPLPYFSLLQLILHALAVVTDSGGMQKEAYFLKKQCLTIREETEWTETIEAKANLLAGSCSKKILSWHRALLDNKLPRSEFIPIYGDGHAAEKIVKHILDFFSSSTVLTNETLRI